MKAVRGFSLIELLIAITLGLLLTGAVITAFVGMKTASGTTTGVASLTDGGRIALDLMQQSMRSAGYMACNSTLAQRNDLAAGTSVVADLTEAIAGYEFNGTGAAGAYTVTAIAAADSTATDWATSPSLGSALDAAIAAQAVVPGSDVLVIHENLPGMSPVFVTSAASPGDFSIATTSLSPVSPPGATTGFGSVLAAGGTPIGVVSNCTASEAFTVPGVGATSVQVGTGGGLALQFGAGSRVSLAETIVFYIGVGQDGDGALFMFDTKGSTAFQGTPRELVPDIENMQVLYGVDTTGTRQVGRYVTADQVSTTGVTGDFNSVIDIKIAVLSAGQTGSLPSAPAAAPVFNLLGTQITAPADTKLRKVFVMTIATRNLTS